MEPTTPAVPRLLALDVGSRRIGVAITVPLGLPPNPENLLPALDHVQPLLTIARKGDHLDTKSIARLVRKHSITELVVGHPLALSGEPTAQTNRVRHFADALRSALALPVHLHDESLSTVAAHEQLAHAGPRRHTKAALAAEKAVIDQVAAVVILQGFLAHRAHLAAIAQARANDRPSSAPTS